MKKRFLLSVIAIGIIIGFSGCSDKSENKIISGRVIDHYIKGATVTTGSQKVKTDEFGKYTLIDRGEALTAKGGVDIATGEAFEGILKAPGGSTVANSLTTMVQSLVENGKTPDEAKKEIQKKLDLPNGVDVTKLDPIENLIKNPNDEEAKKVLVKQTLIQSTLNIVSSTLSKEGVDSTKAFEIATKSFSKEIVNVEELNSSTLKNIVKDTIIKAANESNKTIDETTATTLANKTQEIAVKIENITVNSNTLDEMIKTTEAVQEVAKDIAQNPTIDIETAIDTIEDNISIPQIPKDIFEETITGAEG